MTTWSGRRSLQHASELVREHAATVDRVALRHLERIGVPWSPVLASAVSDAVKRHLAALERAPYHELVRELERWPGDDAYLERLAADLAGPALRAAARAWIGEQVRFDDLRPVIGKVFRPREAQLGDDVAQQTLAELLDWAGRAPLTAVAQLVAKDGRWRRWEGDQQLHGFVVRRAGWTLSEMTSKTRWEVPDNAMAAPVAEGDGIEDRYLVEQVHAVLQGERGPEALSELRGYVDPSAAARAWSRLAGAGPAPTEPLLVQVCVFLVVHASAYERAPDALATQTSERFGQDLPLVLVVALVLLWAGLRACPRIAHVTGLDAADARRILGVDAHRPAYVRAVRTWANGEHILDEWVAQARRPRGVTPEQAHHLLAAKVVRADLSIVLDEYGWDRGTIKQAWSGAPTSVVDRASAATTRFHTLLFHRGPAEPRFTGGRCVCSPDPHLAPQDAPASARQRPARSTQPMPFVV